MRGMAGREESAWKSRLGVAGPACGNRHNQAAKQFAVVWIHLIKLETDAQAGNNSFGNRPRAQCFTADLNPQPPDGAHLHLIVREEKQATIGADVMQFGRKPGAQPHESGGYLAGHSKSFDASPGHLTSDYVGLNRGRR